MKKIVLISFLLFVGVVFSQNNIKITYDGYFDTSIINQTKEGEKLDTIKGYNEMLKSVQKNNKKATYILEGHRNESVFQRMKSMEVDKKLNMSAILGIKGILYTDLELKETLHQANAYGELFLVKSDIDSLNWTLIKESKKIDKYLCYKATTTFILRNNKGDHETIVTAWYTPEIPIRFGPGKYCNLPGLILEVNANKYTYTATAINLNSENNNIKKPKKGKKTSKEEFEEIGLEMTQGFKRN